MGEGGARPSGPARRPATPLASLALGGLAPGRPPPGTEVNGRAVRVHDFLGLRLASARQDGNPRRVPGPSREGFSRAKPVLAHALRSRSAYARPVGCAPVRPRRA